MRLDLRHFAIFFAFLAGTAGRQSALAQTTQPTPPAWNQFVSTISNELSSGDMDSFKASLQSGCPVRAFGDSQNSNCNRLADTLAGQTLLTARSYLGAPATLAGDLAGDSTAPSVPDSVRKLLALPDDPNRAKADSQTAAHWASDALNLSAGDPMAVLVFYMSTADADPAEHPIFVLIKGTEIGPDQFKISAVVFGDPLGD